MGSYYNSGSNYSDDDSDSSYNESDVDSLHSHSTNVFPQNELAQQLQAVNLFQIKDHFYELDYGDFEDADSLTTITPVG